MLKWFAVACVFIAVSIPGAIAQSQPQSKWPNWPPQPSATMEFALAATGGNCAGCQWIAAEGQITDKTPDDFEKFLRSSGWGGSNGKNDTDFDGVAIRLDSVGGSLQAGLDLGNEIQKHRMTTEVGKTRVDMTIMADGKPLNKLQDQEPGVCTSACAYAFLGGVIRTAKAGELQYHQFSAPSGWFSSSTKAAVDAQRTMGQLVYYLQQMKVDPTLLNKVSKFDDSGIYKQSERYFEPSDEDLFHFAITNDKERFSGWGIDAVNGGAQIVGSFKGNGDDAEEIRIQCRQRQPAEILLSITWGGSDKTLSNEETKNIANVLREGIFNTTLTLGKDEVRKQNGVEGLSEMGVNKVGRFYITYPMATQEYNEGLRKNAIILSLETSHALMPTEGRDFAVPTERLADWSSISFKSCTR